MNSRSTNPIHKFAAEFEAALVKDLFLYVRYPAWVIGDFVSTPLWFFFFAMGVTLFMPTTVTSTSGNAFDFFYFGFVFLILFSTAVWGVGQVVRNEQLAGTLEQFFLAPANRVTLIIGRWASVMLKDALIVGYITLIVFFFNGPIPFNDPLFFFVLLGVYEVSLIGLGLILAALTMKMKSYTTLSNIVFFGYMILTGALFPISLIPMPFRFVSMAIPFTYFIDLMRRAALTTPTILPVLDEFALAVALSVILFLMGMWAFDKVEEDARLRGSIATS